MAGAPVAVLFVVTALLWLAGVLAILIDSRVAVAAIGTVTLMWRVRHRGWSASLVLLGAASWGASQILEALQWDGDVRNPGYEAMMATEELLANLGSVCLLLAGLALAQSHAPPRLVREPPAVDQPSTGEEVQVSALHDAPAPG